jgi:hypothetical protein
MNLNLKSKEAKEYSKEEVFLIIQEFIREQIELSQRKTLDEDSFNKPSWSEYQAFQLGMQRAYNKVATFVPTPDPEGN